MRAMRSCLFAFAGTATAALLRMSLRSTTLRDLSFCSDMITDLGGRGVWSPADFIYSSNRQPITSPTAPRQWNPLGSSGTWSLTHTHSTLTANPSTTLINTSFTPATNPQAPQPRLPLLAGIPLSTTSLLSQKSSLLGPRQTTRYRMTMRSMKSHSMSMPNNIFGY